MMRNGEVGGDAHLGDADERRPENGLHLAQEDVAHVLLYEAADLILTGALHGGDDCLPAPAYADREEESLLHVGHAEGGVEGVPVVGHVAQAVGIVPVDAAVGFGHGGEEHVVGHEYAAADASAHEGSPLDGGGLVVDTHDCLPDGAEVKVDEGRGAKVRLGVLDADAVEVVAADAEACLLISRQRLCW